MDVERVHQVASWPVVRQGSAATGRAPPFDVPPSIRLTTAIDQAAKVAVTKLSRGTPTGYAELGRDTGIGVAQRGAWCIAKEVV